MIVSAFMPVARQTGVLGTVTAHFVHIQPKDRGAGALRVLTTLLIPPIHAKLNFGCRPFERALVY
jgi:hypothetical protein